MMVGGKPLIGIVLDENTSTGGDRYEAGKGYFDAIQRAGGVAIGLPYAMDSVGFAEAQCAGLMSTGARIQFPDAWYVDGERSGAPFSCRTAMERAVIRRFLELDRPYLGICNGMQMLGCLTGGRMTGQVAARTDGSIRHDDHATRHPVTLVPGTRSARILAADGAASIIVNSFHREAILQLGAGSVATAWSPDGVLEGLEVTGRRFALGVQWHPERMLDEEAHAMALFEAFVDACRLAL
jgi:putative glutamine amidotransferase